MTNFIVTEKAMRPASDDKVCFYCHSLVGGVHKTDCELVLKKVTVKMTVVYEIEVPSYWEHEQILHHRNEGSWCSDNAIDELTRLSENKGCLCNANVEFEYIAVASDKYLSE